MNLSRLMVLGLLANHGPRHGHQVRRDAERTNIGNWGGVSVGALYREIRQMEREGLLEPMRLGSFRFAEVFERQLVRNRGR